MAFLAINACMSSFKPVPCKLVIKCVGIKPDDLEIPSVVVIVANKTIPALHIRRRVISFIYIDPLLNFLMAIEAFPITHLITQDMAFCTIRSAFELSMNSCKVAWRKLCNNMGVSHEIE